MPHRHFRHLVMSVAIMLGAASCAEPPKPACRSVSGTPSFDYTAIKDIGVVGGCQQVNPHLERLLVTQSPYRLMERERFEQVLEEIRRGESDVFDPATVAQAGRAIGLDGIVLLECHESDVTMRLIDPETFQMLAVETECYKGGYCGGRDAARLFYRAISPYTDTVCG